MGFPFYCGCELITAARRRGRRCCCRWNCCTPASHDSAPASENSVMAFLPQSSETKGKEKKRKRRVKKRRMKCPVRPSALWGELLCSRFPRQHSMHLFPNSRGRDPPKFSEINLRGWKTITMMFFRPKRSMCCCRSHETFRRNLRCCW